MTSQSNDKLDPLEYLFRTNLYTSNNVNLLFKYHDSTELSHSLMVLYTLGLLNQENFDKLFNKDESLCQELLASIIEVTH